MPASSRGTGRHIPASLASKLNLMQEEWTRSVPEPSPYVSLWTPTQGPLNTFCKSFHLAATPSLEQNQNDINASAPSHPKGATGTCDGRPAWRICKGGTWNWEDQECFLSATLSCKQHSQVTATESFCPTRTCLCSSNCIHAKPGPRLGIIQCPRDGAVLSGVPSTLPSSVLPEHGFSSPLNKIKTCCSDHVRQLLSKTSCKEGETPPRSTNEGNRITSKGWTILIISLDQQQLLIDHPKTKPVQVLGKRGCFPSSSLLLGQQLKNQIGKYLRMPMRGGVDESTGRAWTCSQHQTVYSMLSQELQQGGTIKTSTFRAPLESGSKATEVNRSSPTDFSWLQVSFRRIWRRTFENWMQSYSPEVLDLAEEKAGSLPACTTNRRYCWHASLMQVTASAASSAAVVLQQSCTASTEAWGSAGVFLLS